MTKRECITRGKDIRVDVKYDRELGIKRGRRREGKIRVFRDELGREKHV